MPEVKALEYRNLVFGLIALLGISQFLFSIVLMAERYPEKYRWHDQFIDLGRTSTPSGLDNSSNSKLFAMSSLVRSDIQHSAGCKPLDSLGTAENAGNTSHPIPTQIAQAQEVNG